MTLLDDRAVQELVARAEAGLGQLEQIQDPKAQAAAFEAVQGIVDLYGQGLARVMEYVARPEAAQALEAFTADELLAHLLLIHGLHPVDLTSRVQQALEEVRPYLQSHGGNVELLGIEDGVARLRLRGSCSGCPSSTITLKTAIEQAIQKAAPDLEGIEAVEETEPAPQPVMFVECPVPLHVVR